MYMSYNPEKSIPVSGGGALWSSCILTLLHSLTGPVGQPFASRLGGAGLHAPEVHPHFWNWDSPVIVVSLQE
jgi:hypothetical protein